MEFQALIGPLAVFVGVCALKWWDTRRALRGLTKEDRESRKYLRDIRNSSITF